MSNSMLDVVIFAFLCWVCWRLGRARIVALVVAGLLGFFLAGSILAPGINHTITHVATWVDSWSR